MQSHLHGESMLMPTPPVEGEGGWGSSVRYGWIGREIGPTAYPVLTQQINGRAPAGVDPL